MSELVGARIKEARTVAGMSQKKLADAVGTLSASTISKIERGLKEPTEDEVAAIAEALGVSAGTLLGDEGVDIVPNDEEPETTAVADEVPDLTDQTESDTKKAETPAADTSQAKNPTIASLVGMLGSVLGEGEGAKAEEAPAAAETSNKANEGDNNPLAAMLGKVAGVAGAGDNPLAAVLGAAGAGDNPLATLVGAVSDNPKALAALMSIVASGTGGAGASSNPLAAVLGASVGDNPLAALMGAVGDNPKALATLMSMMAGNNAAAGK